MSSAGYLNWLRFEETVNNWRRCGSTAAPKCGKGLRKTLLCPFLEFLYVSVHCLLTASHRIISCVDYGLHSIERYPPCTTQRLANCKFKNQNVLLVASHSRTSTRNGQPLRDDMLLKGTGCTTASFSRHKVKVSQHVELTQYIWDNSKQDATIKFSFS